MSQATSNSPSLTGWVRAIPGLAGGPVGPQLAIARRVAQRFVHERPEVPIAISFATGVLLGWLVKRR
jgi:hypothetical protein